MSNSRMAKIAALAWISLLQYFAMLFVVQSRWTTPYSWLRNAISDLGSDTCFHSAQVDSWVCSPWHTAANVSWIVAGAALAAGGLLALRPFGRTRLARSGLLSFAVSGAGLMIVGLCPEHTRFALHLIGAMIAIPSGELGIFLTALAILRTGHSTVAGWLGIALSATAFTALALLLLGVGGHELFGLWERIAAFPGLIWATLLGFAMRNHTPDDENLAYLLRLHRIPNPRTGPSV